jgi:hypothetical protein
VLTLDDSVRKSLYRPGLVTGCNHSRRREVESLGEKGALEGIEASRQLLPALDDGPRQDQKPVGDEIVGGL